MTYPTDPSDPRPESLIPQFEDDSVDSDLSFSKNRIRIGLALAFIGYLVFLLGARPSLFGLDRSPVVGFVQISVFLLGLAIISLGCYLTLNAFWMDEKKTIAAEIGSRLISTGYVICVFTGMADIFGLGSHPLPNVYFGPLQARGMALGMMTIAVGFLLLIRYKRSGKQSVSSPDGSQQKQEQQTGEPKPVKEEQITISLLSLFQ